MPHPRSIGAHPSRPSALTILVSGYIVRRPVGGLAWHYGHYVAGLARVGHRVVYMEDSGDAASCFRPDSSGFADDKSATAFGGLSTDASCGLAFAADFFRELGMPDAWCYYDASADAWRGPAGPHAITLLAEADILLNVSGSLMLRSWHMSVPKRVLIDTDPVFTQYRNRTMATWLENSAGHNVFLTFGENYGAPGCSVPVDGLPWQPTRQPVVMDAWRHDAPAGATWTTVMSWRSYPAVAIDGQRFGLKEDSFADYLTFPSTAGVPLELAFDGPADVAERLANGGWQVRDAATVTKTPWTYREYLRGSRGEFGLAKSAYVTSRSGWFSERSAAYLASGRPVVCQDTGSRIPSGDGLIHFHDAEGARSALAEVESDWRRHSSHARDLAAAWFDAASVLPDMLSMIHAVGDDSVDVTQCPGFGVLCEYRRIADVVQRLVPPPEEVLLIDGMALGVERSLGDRRIVPFPSRDGVYWGEPANGEEAVREIRLQRAQGHRYVALASSSFWWLEYFPEFARHLGREADRISDERELILFRLR